MTKYPAGLSHCVATQFARHLADASWRVAGRPAVLKISPRHLAVKPPQPGVGCAYALRLSPVMVIAPGYPVVFVSRTARCSGAVLFNDSPQSGKLMKHSPVTITPLARIHG